MLRKYVIPLVAKRWYDLGLELLDSKHETSLEIFEENFGSNVEICCKKTLMKWLETKSDDATWGQLAKALENIDMHTAANNVKEILQQSVVGE